MTLFFRFHQAFFIAILLIGCSQNPSVHPKHSTQQVYLPILEVGLPPSASEGNEQPPSFQHGAVTQTLHSPIEDLILSTDQPAKLCSPLYSTSLSELSTIISDPYHPPLPGSDERHQGVDFAYYRQFDRVSIDGDSVQAILPGAIAAVVKDRYPYGNLVIIETPIHFLPGVIIDRIELTDLESLYVLYAHLSEQPNLEIGEWVNACQMIGHVGKTGNAGASHLHLETRIGPIGSTFTSLAYYETSSTAEEKKNYRLWRTSGIFRHFDPMILLDFY